MTPSEMLKALFATLALICFIAFMSARAEANQNPTDWHDHYLSQQLTAEELSRAEAEANAEWKQRHGEWQPNLTLETEKYLQKQTALLETKR